MKRIICILLIAISILSFASCGGASSDKNTCETLNKIFTKDNSLVNIEVKTVTNEKSLASMYTVVKETNGEKITYSIEKLSTFEEVNGEYIVPESYKTTIKGEVLLSNGAVVSQSGDIADLDFTKTEIPKFKFNEGYFSNVQDNAGKFTADVTNPSGFLGAEISCSNMSVTVSYSENKISEIILNYSTDKSTQTTLKYFFE